MGTACYCNSRIIWCHKYIIPIATRWWPARLHMSTIHVPSAAMTHHLGMPMRLPPASGKRKKPLLSDDIEISQPHRPNKRIKIDQLLQNLSLDGGNNRFDGGAYKRTPVSEFSINPLVDIYDNQPKKPTLESYISGKMIDEYCSQYNQSSAVWRCFLPRALVVYHFQVWVHRLFNGFVRLYNERNKGRKPVKLFKSYFNVLWLVQDPNVQFTMEDLWHIMRQQNVIEKEKMALKRDKRMNDKRLEEIYDEQKILEDCNYQYWNRFSQLHRDAEMEEADSPEPVLDTGMDLDSPIREMYLQHEASYGSYYGTEMRW